MWCDGDESEVEGNGETKTELEQPPDEPMSSLEWKSWEVPSGAYWILRILGNKGIARVITWIISTSFSMTNNIGIISLNFRKPSRIFQGSLFFCSVFCFFLSDVEHLFSILKQGEWEVTGNEQVWVVSNSDSKGYEQETRKTKVLLLYQVLEMIQLTVSAAWKCSKSSDFSPVTSRIPSALYTKRYFHESR